ncbi:MAG: trehalose-6-phosphate synthase [Acidimicrobiales bacterium]|nr:MAG: trehalose-6-phosphate synthase [Acidimicrobiales bacterium]
MTGETRVRRDSEPVVVVASNRGPVTHQRGPDGDIRPRRGGGGLVSALSPLLRRRDSLWIASAMSEVDREMAGRTVRVDGGLQVQFVDIEAARLRRSYDLVCNGTLWFLHHHLFDATRRPVFDRRWWEAWSDYVDMNRSFAAAIRENAPEGSVVLVQDYHLCLVAEELRLSGSGLASVHFSHTPFAAPETFRILPSRVRKEILSGMAAFDSCGFHTARWRDCFLACCDQEGVEPPSTFVAPLGPDEQSLKDDAVDPRCVREWERILESAEGRRLIVRVDRIEPSKNILRGLRAFDELLETHPEHRGEVVFAHFLYPSRQRLPEYTAYHKEVLSLAEHLNRKWGDAAWTPVVVDDTDDHLRSLAALGAYDVLVVNPVRDGLNLVAKEGPLVNRRDGEVILSTEAGAYEELGETAHGVEPFDVSATAEAMHAALTSDETVRRSRAARLKELAAARTPEDWLLDQLSAVGAL